MLTSYLLSMFSLFRLFYTIYFTNIKYFSTYKSIQRKFFSLLLYFLCLMQNSFEQIEAQLVTKIYKEFLVKFDGNKSKFAKASSCSETTVRRVFLNKQRMTLDLLLRFCSALEIEVVELFKNINK